MLLGANKTLQLEFAGNAPTSSHTIEFIFLLVASGSWEFYLSFLNYGAI